MFQMNIIFIMPERNNEVFAIRSLDFMYGSVFNFEVHVMSDIWMSFQ